MFQSIISRPAPPPPAPFVFSSTLVEKKAPLLKASALQLVTLSSNATKSTKTPNLGFQRKSSSKLVNMADAQKSEKPSRFQKIELVDARKSEKSLQAVFTDGACTDNGKDDARAGIGVFFGTMKMIETCQS